MVKQYGAPDDPPGQGKASNRYADRRKDAEPKPKEEDPSPPEEVVTRFHKNVPVDTRREDIHHTLGFGPTNAAPGDHNHRSEGTPLFDGLTVSGSRGGNAALLSLLNILAQFGLKDSTTP